MVKTRTKMPTEMTSIRLLDCLNQARMVGDADAEADLEGEQVELDDRAVDKGVVQGFSS